MAQQDSITIHKKPTYLDSIHAALKYAPNDTIRMNVYRNISVYYLETQRDSALYYREQQLRISQQLKLRIWEANALTIIGYIYMNKGNYPLSLRYLLDALKILEDPASEKSSWSLKHNESPHKARLEILDLTHNILGHVYGATGNSKEQIIQYRLSEKYAIEINDIHRLSMVNMNLGTTYISLGKLDSSLDFSMKALGYNDQNAGAWKYRGVILNNIGTVYLKKGNFELAKQHFSDAIRASQDHNNLQSLADSYLGIAHLFRDSGMSDSSLWYARKALDIFKQMGSPAGLVSAYTSLASIYKLGKNMDSAFLYQEKANTAKDSQYNAEKLIQFQNIGFDEQIKLRELEKEKILTKNRTRTFALVSGIAAFIVITFLLVRNNRHRRKTNVELENQKHALQATLSDLKDTQAQLIQSEKMASLGELTAGIAHEIKNPLNFINNFSDVNSELIDELQQELATGNKDQAIDISNAIKDNEQKINHHGKRADAIVKSMLQHSRGTSGGKEPTDINALADEYLRLAYHGLRAKDNSFAATTKSDFDNSIGTINVVPQDIGRALLNLITNAFYAVDEKRRQHVNKLTPGTGGFPTDQAGYDPVVVVSTKKTGDKVLISVKDNGNGIPPKSLDKIFQPFFTTKPTGQGTGLGLSLTYDIVKAHDGQIKVESIEDNGSHFTIELPIN